MALLRASSRAGWRNVYPSAPVRSGTDTRWTNVSTHDQHTLGLRTDGTLWSWGFNPEERAAISRIRGVATVHDLTPPLALGVAPCVLGAVRRLPRQVRYSLPVLPILEVTFRSAD